MGIRQTGERFSKRNVLLSGEKLSTTRRALLLIPQEPAREGDRALLKAIDQLYSSRYRIQQALEEALEHLEEATDLIFPRFKVDVRRKTVQQGNIKHAFDDLEEKSAIRLFANLTNTPTDGSGVEVSIEAAGISHLVSFTEGKKMPGWRAGSGASDANVFTTQSRLSYLIVDVVLDIAMFHSWPYLRDHYSTLEKKRDFSLRKVSFARERGLSSFYGPVSFDGLNYFSLASSVRGGEAFSLSDCRRYEELWRDFLKEEMVGAPVRINAVRGELERIARGHARGGQISPRRLEERISNLEKGSYVLVVATRRPRGDKELRRLVGLFSRSNWKTNMWVIVKLHEIGKYIRIHPYVKFWRFQVK